MNFYRYETGLDARPIYLCTLEEVMKQARFVLRDLRDNIRVQLVDIPVDKISVCHMVNGQEPPGVTTLKRWRLGSTARSVELVALGEGEE